MSSAQRETTASMASAIGELLALVRVADGLIVRILGVDGRAVVAVLGVGGTIGRWGRVLLGGGVLVVAVLAVDRLVAIAVVVLDARRRG